jgi:regulator of replication initiation timing
MGKLMSEKNGRRKFGLSRSFEDFEMGASSHPQTKTRLNVTVLPRTSNWLKGRGNASHAIDELVDTAIAGNLKPADNPSQKLAELIRENSELKAELSQLQSQLQKEPEQRQDYEAIRDKVLTSLKLGKLAPGYKSAVKALNRFIAEIQ